MDRWLAASLCAFYLAVVISAPVNAETYQAIGLETQQGPAAPATGSPVVPPPAEMAQPMTYSTGGSGIGASKSLFDKGQVRGGIGAGWGTALGENYFVMSGSLGYYLLKGLEASIDGEAWFGQDPEIYKVSPGLRYVFPLTGSIAPYIGGFYRRTFYSGSVDDLDSVGGRAGAYLPLGRKVYTSVGFVFERPLNCEDRIYDQCSVAYPEFAVSVVF